MDNFFISLKFTIILILYRHVFLWLQFCNRHFMLLIYVKQHDFLKKPTLLAFYPDSQLLILYWFLYKSWIKICQIIVKNSCFLKIYCFGGGGRGLLTFGIGCILLQVFPSSYVKSFRSIQLSYLNICINLIYADL